MTTDHSSAIKSSLGNFVAWAFTVVFFILWLPVAFGGGGLFPAIIGLALVAFCSPMGRRKLQEKTGVAINGWAMVLGCFALFALMMTLSSEGLKAHQEKKATQAAKASAEQEAKTRAAEKAEFEGNRAAILADITTKFEAGKFDDALAVVNKYAGAIDDVDLAKARTTVQVAKVKATLKDERGLTLEDKVKAYTALASLEPSNSVAAKKASEYQAQIDKRKADAKAAEEKAAAAAARTKLVEAQFSAWDGSHPGVERAVKRAMKNPDSYQHVETRYIDKGDHLVVLTTVRGTNSFGGVVPSSFRATVDLKGNLLSLADAR